MVPTSVGQLFSSAALFHLPVVSVAVLRLAQRPFTFSNGVTVPAGTQLAAPACAIHMDEEIYPNPEQLDGFRFSKTCDINGHLATTGFSSVSTSPTHLSFGLGRHAW